mmetsp:Transcript_53094/g.124604  ORF Transcript_53094/g.124604 Transcript_53094/m.124604 type:complete len:219 (+) Transcript_53094:18-674(+)
MGQKPLCRVMHRRCEPLYETTHSPSDRSQPRRSRMLPVNNQLDELFLHSPDRELPGTLVVQHTPQSREVWSCKAQQLDTKAKVLRLEHPTTASVQHLQNQVQTTRTATIEKVRKPDQGVAQISRAGSRGPDQPLEGMRKGGTEVVLLLLQLILWPPKCRVLLEHSVELFEEQLGALALHENRRDLEPSAVAVRIFGEGTAKSAQLFYGRLVMGMRRPL